MNLGKKILVVGANGSGKTTFAKKLSNILNIPHYELDNIFWKPDWQESENDEFREKVDKVTIKDEWVVDGNYTRNQDLTLFKADTVVWLDYPLFKITYRVIKRSIKRSFTREPLWHNNKESFRRMFVKDSIILFAIKSYKRKRNRYIKLIKHEDLKHIKWILIRNTREEREFWREINTHRMTPGHPMSRRINAP